MYTPNYDKDGNFTMASNEAGSFVPVTGKGQETLRFRTWLRMEGKALEEWIAETPYVPRVKTQTELDREGLLSDLESGTARFDADFQRKLAKLL